MKMEELLESAAWQRKEGKSKSGGLNKKGVASYRRQHPGSKLQTAVTTKPSKLKKGSKASKRRKSFCARMKGMKKHRTGAKTKRDPNSRINKALRKWHCEGFVPDQNQIFETIMKLENFLIEKKKMSAKDDPCWKGYHMVGKKKKNGREVPNCVPGTKGS